MGCGAKSPGWAERLRERAYVTELMTLFYIFFSRLPTPQCFTYMLRLLLPVLRNRNRNHIRIRCIRIRRPACIDYMEVETVVFREKGGKKY